MGLTIHFAFAAGKVSTDRARELVRQLREAAIDLFAGNVGSIVEVREGSCSQPKIETQWDADFLMATLPRPVVFTVDGEERGGWVSPEEFVAFLGFPGEGCEMARIGLARFPESIECEGQSISTGLDGWTWQGFVKTQYGSNELLGGMKNFLRCHLGLISLLDRAKELGILEKVVDEGGYWEGRDVAALVKEVGRWNKMIAGFVGRLQDGLERAGGDRGRLVSEIAKFPDFEYLEAEGRTGEDEGR